MSAIEKILKENKAIDDYRLTEKATKTYELFFVHRKLETVRSSDTVSREATVYVDHDGARGDSTFHVYASMSEAQLKKAVDAAAERAKLVFNQPYVLPEKGELTAELPTNMKDVDAKELGAKIAEAVFAADDVEGGSINALEIFFYTDTVRVTNSRGIDKTQTKHRVMIEAIPTFTSDRESVELYEDFRFTEFDPAKVTEEIASKMREVRDRSLAVKPATPLTVNVILRGKEIEELLFELADDCRYSAVYMHANLHKIGDNIQGERKGDKLTLTMRAGIPGSEDSSFFDADGTELSDTCVIREGVVESNYGPSRFGQYIGVEKPTGDLGCIELEAGTLTEEEIKKAPYIECAALSGLQVDPYNDYIGGEIRLAYYFDGEKTVPVTGITMSARLSEVLSSLRLSEKTARSGAYFGPEKLLMKDVSVL